ncbi:MAG: hypothetical protein LAT50_12270 [Ectothiorhodospiraceae bacterium]|nr:hypothetical protein [Ectothiorhodospiraceae bacterium]
MKTSLMTLVAGLLLAAASVAIADNDHTYVITLNSDEEQTQGMALELATALAREEGNTVHIVLCGDAGELAIERNIPPSLEPRSVSPKEMMMEAMTFEAEVYLCHFFLPNSRARQYEETDLEEGITQINSTRLAELVS